MKVEKILSYPASFVYNVNLFIHYMYGYDIYIFFFLLHSLFPDGEFSIHFNLLPYALLCVFPACLSASLNFIEDFRFGFYFLSLFCI